MPRLRYTKPYRPPHIVPDDGAREMWLMTRPWPKFVGPVCQSDKPVDHGPHQPAGPCTRPVWMDHLCAACWHERQAFHGHWTLLSGAKIAAMPNLFGEARGTVPWNLNDLLGG